jgi:hypothetical protein
MGTAGEPPTAHPGGAQPAGGLTVEEELGREGVTGLKRCRKLQALTPGSAVSERTVRCRLRMFVFDSRVSEDSAACRAHTHGHRRPVRVYRDITRPPAFCSVNSLTSVTQAGPFTTTPGRSGSSVERGKGDTDDSCRDSGAYL